MGEWSKERKGRGKRKCKRGEGGESVEGRESVGESVGGKREERV